MVGVSIWESFWLENSLTSYNTIVLTCHPMAHRDTSHSVSHTRPRPPCGSLPFQYLLCKLTHPYHVTLLPTDLGYFRAKPSLICIPQLFLNLVIIYLLVYEDGTECSETSAYKIQTQKKSYNIQNKATVSNQEIEDKYNW